MNLSENFKLWLTSQGFNNNTIRNYVADVNKYLSVTPESQVFNSQSISSHLHQLSDKKNSARYLASFNKFCQFAKDQNLIASDPVKKTRSLINLKPEIERYQSYLFKKNKSPKTIQNYINDLNQFISWIETQNPSVTKVTSPLEKRETFESVSFQKNKIIFSLPFFKGRSGKAERDFESK